MADKRATDFTALTQGQISESLEWYTQVPTGVSGLDAGEYKGTLGQLALFLAGLGFLKMIPGTHIDDDAAITAGGTAGDGYQLAINNAYNIPVGNGGVIKIIQ